MTIASMNGIVAALPTGQRLNFYKGTLTMVAGSYYSLWRSGGIPTNGLLPVAAPINPTSATVGALPLAAAPAGQTSYLARVAVSSTVASTLTLVDRLGHMGALSGTSVAEQPVNVTLTTPAAAGRCQPNGSDVEWYLEWHTATGGTAVTATVAYVDGADNPQTLDMALTATRPVGYLQRMIPTVDGGIKSVTSLTLSVSTGAVGAFGVVAMKRIAEVPVNAPNVGVVFDYAQLGLPVIADTACLAYIIVAPGNTSGNQTISHVVISG